MIFILYIVHNVPDIHIVKNNHNINNICYGHIVCNIHNVQRVKVALRNAEFLTVVS